MIPPTRTLVTERLILQPCRTESCDHRLLILRTYNDPFIGAWGFAKVGLRIHEDVVKKHNQHGPRNRPEMCTHWMRKYGEVANVMFHLVYLKNSEGEAGEYIGFVGNNFRTEVDMGPDFGYAFFEQFNGKGYASEAGRVAVKWWQEEAGVKDLWLGTFDDNVASQRCAKKIGFVEGGETIIKFGNRDQDVVRGRGYILPGMHWPDGGLVIRPTIQDPQP